MLIRCISDFLPAERVVKDRYVARLLLDYNTQEYTITRIALVTHK